MAIFYVTKITKINSDIDVAHAFGKYLDKFEAFVTI